MTELARAWGVAVRWVVRTPTSLVAFGVRRGDDVVLKVVSGAHEEWDAGAVVAAFRGCGMVRALEQTPGAVLLERATPGTALTEVVRAGRDDAATEIVAGVVDAMLEVSPPTAGYATARDWGAAFAGHLARGDRRLPTDVVEEARDRYLDLCQTQAAVRLLHGDLQHYNILLDADRGWVAIDPKGVVAEVAFELGAALRNPAGVPELYTASALDRRVDRLVAALGVDRDRVLAWTFAQAVLSAIWTIENEGELDPGAPAVQVMNAARPLLT